VAVSITNQGEEQQHTITVFNIYNPNPLPPYDRLDGLPRGCMLPKLNNAIRRMNGPDHSTVVVGDFNLHHPRWEGPEAGYNCRTAAEYLIEITENNGLELGFEPGLITRPAKGAGINPSTIDLSFITSDITDHLIQTGINKELDKGSDHLPVETVFGFRLEREEEPTRRLFKKMNKEIFHNVLKDLPEVPLALSQDQIDTVTVRIIDTLTKAVELSTPVAKLSPRSKPGWTDECTQTIKTERRARRHFNRCSTEENHIILQIARREKDKAIRKATKMEHRNRVSEVKDMKDSGPYTLGPVNGTSQELRSRQISETQQAPHNVPWKERRQPLGTPSSQCHRRQI